MSSRIEQLENIHAKNAAAQQIVVGAAQLIEGGPALIQEVANDHPDIMLAALVGMAGVINMMQGDINYLAEELFKLEDQLEETQ